MPKRLLITSASMLPNLSQSPARRHALLIFFWTLCLLSPFMRKPVKEQAPHEAQKRHHQDTACPRCGEDLSNRSESHKLDHLSGWICSPREDEDEPGVEAFVDNEVPAPEFNGMARGNLPEQWNKRVIDVDKSLLAEAEDEEKLCDSILVNGLRGMGHELSDRAFSDLFKLLNLQEFRSGFQKGQLSKSFVSVLNDSKNNTCWMERTIRKSVVYVRDLLEVSLLNFGRRKPKILQGAFGNESRPSSLEFI
jgi:hypothetical protein